MDDQSMAFFDSFDFFDPWNVPIFLIGLCMGSFLTVCVDRIPLKQSVVRPRSYCSCGKRIAWYDTSPVLSWLLLKGRARCCGVPISGHYPLIELSTGMVFLLCWLRLPPLLAIAGMLFSFMLLAAAFIDLNHMMIPDRFSMGLMGIGLGLSFLFPTLHGYNDDLLWLDHFRSGVSSLIGAVVGAGVLLWIGVWTEKILKQDAMGLGDVKFIGGIGAFCGWQGALFALFGGAALGTVVLLPLIGIQYAFRKRRRGKVPSSLILARLFNPVPFTPMLALGAWLYYVWLHPSVTAYFYPLEQLF